LQASGRSSTGHRHVYILLYSSAPAILTVLHSVAAALLTAAKRNNVELCHRSLQQACSTRERVSMSLRSRGREDALMDIDRRGNRSKGAAGTAESGGVLSRLCSCLVASIVQRAYGALTYIGGVSRVHLPQSNTRRPQPSVATINTLTSHRPWHHPCSESNSTSPFPAPKRLGMGIKRRAAFSKTSLMSDKSSVL
jgi:hypothetical protein